MKVEIWSDVVCPWCYVGKRRFEAALARIDALNPLLRAVVTIQRERAGSRKVGPLAGVPFLVKDASPWPGLRWSIGARLFAHNVAPQHTPYGQRLAEAGLMCVGKSATSELGLLGSTETLLEGVTHNPWDLACSAAGSSGGSAAAVAAGLVPFAHANDGGGSIRIPASLCGTVGLKPSFGRISRAGIVPHSWSLDTAGPLTRSVTDAAIVLANTRPSLKSQR